MELPTDRVFIIGEVAMLACQFHMDEIMWSFFGSRAEFRIENLDAGVFGWVVTGTHWRWAYLGLPQHNEDDEEFVEESQAIYMLLKSIKDPLQDVLNAI